MKIEFGNKCFVYSLSRFLVGIFPFFGVLCLVWISKRVKSLSSEDVFVFFIHVNYWFVYLIRVLQQV